MRPDHTMQHSGGTLASHSLGSRSRREARIARADAYLAARTGTYEYRCQRYRAAADVLRGWGLSDAHTVMDVGAGWTEFSALLHTEYGWLGRYIPVDACVDGRDFEVDGLPREADFIVCLELIEHLSNPYGFLLGLRAAARHGVVVSTPNPEVVDVLAMDETHRTACRATAIGLAGFTVERRSFLGQQNDSLLARWCRSASGLRNGASIARVTWDEDVPARRQGLGLFPPRQPGWDE